MLHHLHLNNLDIGVQKTVQTVVHAVGLVVAQVPVVDRRNAFFEAFVGETGHRALDLHFGGLLLDECGDLLPRRLV
ncbi:hypothetical protein OGATHE_000700 [Ogataea polymorpha]|uniref:Uncharacterized protein n=1 Tax=Ogataea polymorpha TaxID=460523 RepID=A0A9P8PUX0_9ASCO|nr:hypothetical protein OGATHE_000700 [Ogataea polymorpha]